MDTFSFVGMPAAVLIASVRLENKGEAAAPPRAMAKGLV